MAHSAANGIMADAAAHELIGGRKKPADCIDDIESVAHSAASLADPLSHDAVPDGRTDDDDDGRGEHDVVGLLHFGGERVAG